MKAPLTESERIKGLYFGSLLNTSSHFFPIIKIFEDKLDRGISGLSFIGIITPLLNVFLIILTYRHVMPHTLNKIIQNGNLLFIKIPIILLFLCILDGSVN